MKNWIFNGLSLLGVVIIFGGSALAKENASHKYSEFKCGKTAMERSSCMIRAILDDVKATHPMLDNGGISEIKGLSTYSYRVTIPRNEAKDLITYEFGLQKNNKLKILNKTVATDSAK